MKIKLAILEKDTSYLNRIVTAFNTKYVDKFQIYSFTDQEVALATLDSARIDVFIASDVFDIDTKQLPKRCGFAYFVDFPDIDMIKDQRAICKFQKADLIYKQILSLYSENAGGVSGIKLGDDSAQVIAFTSPSGGTGCSTMAAACAMHFASQGKNVIYLNLEKYGSADTYFAAEGQFDMSDIIFALKSKKANLSLKLESCVKQHTSGVNFFSQPKIVLDMMEVNAEDIIRLVSEIKLTCSYDYIILDLDFGIDKDSLKVYKMAHALVWVGDGSTESNMKIFRVYNALETLEANADSKTTESLCLIYNKFSSKTSRVLEAIDAKNVGGAPKYEHATTVQVLQQLSAMDMFDKIL